MSRRQVSIECVDLFCGLGGLTHGLSRGGVKVVAGIDLDPRCRTPYEANNDASFLERDLRYGESTEISKLFSPASVKLLAGCAPCQPFSTYSQKARNRRPDSMWDLVGDFGRMVREIEPDLVTMENVPRLVNYPGFERFLRDLAGYEVFWKILDCASYGVPQTRKRLVLLASRLGPVSLLPPSGEHRQTVRQAISGLKPLAAGESDPGDALHSACSLSELNLRRIRASKPGGTWRDWTPDLRADCHVKISGQTYPSVYGRMTWDEPAPTMTTQCFGFGNGRFGHPEQDRAITLREAAILQTFPVDYQFVEEGQRVSFQAMGRMIGNAVPVRVGELIAQSLVRHLSAHVGVKQSQSTTSSRSSKNKEPRVGSSRR